MQRCDRQRLALAGPPMPFGGDHVVCTFSANLLFYFYRLFHKPMSSCITILPAELVPSHVYRHNIASLLSAPTTATHIQSISSSNRLTVSIVHDATYTQQVQEPVSSKRTWGSDERRFLHRNPALSLRDRTSRTSWSAHVPHSRNEQRTSSGLIRA